jgi:hypothetical protein
MLLLKKIKLDINHQHKNSLVSFINTQSGNQMKKSFKILGANANSSTIEN